MYVINDCWKSIKTEVMRKLEDSVSGRVKTELNEKCVVLFEIVTDNKVHAAFLHTHVLLGKKFKKIRYSEKLRCK